MKKIKSYINKYSNRPQLKKETSEKIKVFTFWEGEEKEIVQICFDSMNSFLNKDYFELIKLNRQLAEQYVDLSYLKNKNISIQHYTDILRFELLSKYGGFWLDATCLLTSDFYKATENIRKNNFFLFSYSNTRVGTWFFWSKPNAYPTRLVLESLKLWWKKKNYLTNYFMAHDFIEMLYWIDDNYKKEWDNIPKTHPRNALALLNNYQKKHYIRGFYPL